MKLKSNNFIIFSIVISLLLGSCDLKKDKSQGVLARVGQKYLYIEDVKPLLSSNVSAQDSAVIVTNYINNWAAKHLLMDKAKINLSEDKLADYNNLVEEYRTDLYTRAYKEALIWQASDSVVTDAQLNQFYEKEKENFKLKEKLVRLRYVELPKEFINTQEVKQSLRNFKEKDRAFLDSIGVQFRRLNFDDSIWLRASRVINEIGPLTYENESKYLKKDQFFELADDNGVYLAQITDLHDENDIAPITFIKPTLKQVILNRRKLAYGRQLETEIIDEAIKDKEFELYEHKE